jgi:hypothetical protein
MAFFLEHLSRLIQSREFEVSMAFFLEHLSRLIQAREFEVSMAFFLENLSRLIQARELGNLKFTKNSAQKSILNH